MAVISRRTGPVSFEIELDGRGIVKRHVDQIRKRWCYIPKIPDIIPSTKLESPPTLDTQMPNPSVQPSESEPQSSILESEQSTTNCSECLASPKVTTPPVRKSTRVQKRPDRYIENCDYCY